MIAERLQKASQRLAVADGGPQIMKMLAFTTISVEHHQEEPDSPKSRIDETRSAAAEVVAK
jgi:hypothetical protein